MENNKEELNKIGLPEDKHTCMFCEQQLRWIPQVNTNTNEVDNILICHDCDQSFLWKDNQIGVLPYDSKMQLITIKCNECEHIEHHRYRMIYLLSDDGEQIDYCPKCFKEQVKDISPENYEQLDINNLEQLHLLAEMLYMKKANEIFSNPDKIINIIEKFKDVKKEL